MLNEIDKKKDNEIELNKNKYLKDIEEIKRKYNEEIKLILRCPILKKIYMNSNQSKKTKMIDFLEKLIDAGKNINKEK